MEDKKISEAIKLLYKGAKMLPYHCPDCGVPIFQYQDKMICPSCGKEAVFESELKGDELKPNDEAKQMQDELGSVKEFNEESIKPQSAKADLERLEKTKSMNLPVETSNFKFEINKKIKEVLELKINDISDLLANAKSPKEIERLLNLLERIFSLLKEIENKEG